MLSTDQVIENVAARIGWIYGRPLMYGGTAEGVELQLVSLHEIWAMCQEREAEYWQAFHDLHAQESHSAMNCSTYYSRENPGASENETVAYVVEFFKRLDGRLGLVTEADGVARPAPGK